MRLSRLDIDRGRGYEPMTPSEFFALPLSERIQLMLHHQMRFYDEASNPLPVADGLKLLRELRPGQPS